MISWTGLAGPPNLPKPIVDRLNAEMRKALAVPEVKSRLEAMGGDPRATTPDEMKALVQRQYDTWKKLAVGGEPVDQLAAGLSLAPGRSGDRRARSGFGVRRPAISGAPVVGCGAPPPGFAPV